jgi:hypothetical protein
MTVSFRDAKQRKGTGRERVSQMLPSWECGAPMQTNLGEAPDGLFPNGSVVLEREAVRSQLFHHILHSSPSLYPDLNPTSGNAPSGKAHMRDREGSCRILQGCRSGGTYCRVKGRQRDVGRTQDHHIGRHG